MSSTLFVHFAVTISLLVALFLGRALADPDGPSAAYPKFSTQTIKDPAARCQMQAELERLQKIQAQVEDRILELPGVIGFGIGRSDDGLLFNVLGDQSQPQPDLPRKIEGVPVQAQPQDPIQLLNGFPGCRDTSPCHVDQQPFPVEMGNSGNWGSQTGSGACSLGFKACDLGTGNLVFVTKQIADSQVQKALGVTISPNASSKVK